MALRQPPSNSAVPFWMRLTALIRSLCSQAAATAGGADGGLDQQATTSVIALKGALGRQGDAQGGFQRSGLKSPLRGEPQHDACKRDWLAGSVRGVGGTRPPRLAPEGKRERGIRYLAPQAD